MVRSLVALVVVASVASVASAGPKYAHDASTSNDPDVMAAEHLWATAKTSADWDAVSAAFMKVVDRGKGTTAERLVLAHSALSALKNRMNTDPRVRDAAGKDDFDRLPPKLAMPAHEQQMLHVMEVYRSIDPTSDEAISVEFLQANLLRRFGHFDDANVLFQDILDHHREHEVAEYAANLLLDTLNRQQRYDELVALASALRADKRFMDSHADLAQLLATIHLKSLRDLGGDGESIVEYERLGEEYVVASGELRANRGADEALYTALGYFERAHAMDRALDTAAELELRFPKSPLRANALARSAAIHGQIMHIAEAAAAIEELLRRFPDRRDATEARFDAVKWQLALGNLDRAAHHLEVLAHTNLDESDRARVKSYKAQIQEERAPRSQRPEHIDVPPERLPHAGAPAIIES